MQGGEGRRVWGVFCVLVLILAIAAPAVLASDVLPWELKIEKVLDNTASLGDIAQSPAGELWVLERAGTIKVFENGTEAASLTISVSTACDAGLLDVAFSQDYGTTGLALVYYVDPGGTGRVDQVFRGADGLSLGAKVLDLGSNGSGCRIGGGLATGTDGKLFVAVGDFETSSDAQNDASLSGKVLRANFDGSIPSDNPDPASLVFAKGFRNGSDLALNPHTARAGGTLYSSDLGQATVYDEIDAVRSGGNYGWDNTSGDSGGTYDDPLVAYNPVVGTEAVESLSADSFGAGHDGSAVFACTNEDEIRETALSGGEMDVAGSSGTFYDPDGDRDGTPDTLCPKNVHALALGGEGELYAGADGANPGIWRIWRDTPGAREVSAPGSPFQMTVEKSGADVTLGWENLGDLDVGLPARNGGQHAQDYQIWEGSLPLTGSYDHTSKLTTDGNPSGTARLTAAITPETGNRYFLVSAQGDNMEGTTGAASDGAARPTGGDYCDALGWGNQEGQCAFEFKIPGTEEVLKLTDYNPYSPTYMQELSLEDFRGIVYKLALTSDNCFWCEVEADQEGVNDEKYGHRDFTFISVFTLAYSYWTVVPADQCDDYISAWADAHNSKTPILCDEDHDGDGRGDATVQWDISGGAPQNFYVDQGNVMYHFASGAQFSGDVESAILPEINPETCE